MHFNSSCPYAGLANMLALQGHDTQDFQIALDMNLPFLLHYDAAIGYYQAGPSLQSAVWFDLYLKPRGFRYVEAEYGKEEALRNLARGTMLGIRVSGQARHAVVFLEQRDGLYVFLNNKWEDSPEPERIQFSAQECLARLPERVVTGHLARCEAERMDFTALYRDSIATWERLRKELRDFMSREQTPQALRESMNRLFRPLLLDGLTMMQLLHEDVLTEKLRALQTSYLETIRKNEAVRLADCVGQAATGEAIDDIITLIRKRAEGQAIHS